MSRGNHSRVAWVLAAICMLAGTLTSAQSHRGSGHGAASAAAATTSAAPVTEVPTVATVAANVCIAPEARARALQCPAGSQRYGTHANTAPPSAARATQDNGVKNANTKKQAPAGTIDQNTFRRRQAIQARSADLLLREAQLTATLVNRMNRTDSHRAEALMRLAEDYQELSTQLNGQAEDLEDNLFRARQAHDQHQITDITNRQRGFRDQAAVYRTSLIAAFRHLVEDHPNYPQMDRALFYLAFAYQDSNDFNNARVVYRTLIQRFPQSPFVPNAYLSFAEYFFEQGQMEDARQFYERVLQVQDESNQVYGYALYKMAWVLYNLQQYDESLNKFYAVIDYGRAHPDNPSVTPLLRNARMELVTVYGAVFGTAARPLNTMNALNTFRRYASDENNAFEMFEKLAELYEDNGQWPNSIASYHTLMEQRSSNDRFCFWQYQVARAVVASQQKPAQLTEVQRLVDVYNAYRHNAQRSAQVRNDCRDYAAREVFDVASHWHLEAIGRSAEGAVQTRGTRNPQTMQMAAQLYQVIIDQFPEFDSVTFPDYDRRDWPTLYRVSYYRADILRDQGNNEACGPAYDHVIEMNPSGEYTEDAAYKAVLCYNDWFSQQFAHAATEHPNRTAQAAAAAVHGRNAHGVSDEQARIAERARLVPRDLNAQETGMLRAFTRYVCFVQPTPSTDPNAENPLTTMLTIKYRRAYLYYNANHFEEASTLFHDIAHSDQSVPDPENLREISADLYLDSLNVMGDSWNPQRPACFSGMAEELPTLLPVFCSATMRPNHEDFCHRVEDLQCQVLRKHSEALDATHQYRQAGDEYVGIVRTHRECGRLDEMLYDAAIEYDKANLLGRAMRVRERMVQLFLDRNSPWAQRALYRLAGNYHAIQVFSRAAALYEQFAEYVNTHRADAVAAARAAHEAAPSIPVEDPISQAADALRQATIFRIGLGEEDHALENAQKFERYFRADASRRRDSANVDFSIGQIYVDRVSRLRHQTGGTPDERHERELAIRTAWGDVVRHYSAYMHTYAAQGTLDQQIQGAVALGRGYWNQDNIPQATQYFQQAVTAWGAAAAEGQQSPGEHTIHEQLGDAAGDAIEKSKDAVAEAKFYLAEVLYRRFMTAHLPTIPGTTRRAFDTWATTRLTPYIQERQGLLDSAQSKYMEVIALHVPNWEIAAASRLADMYFQFAQTIRTSPVPPDVQHNADLLDAWNVLRDERTQPFMNTASTGFQRCIQTSTAVHWFNDWSQLCERELNVIDRNRFPIADEVRVQPTLLFSRPNDSRPVYTLQTAAESAEEEGGAAENRPDTTDAPASHGGGQ